MQQGGHPEFDTVEAGGMTGSWEPAECLPQCNSECTERMEEDCEGDRGEEGCRSGESSPERSRQIHSEAVTEVLHPKQLTSTQLGESLPISHADLT